VLARQKREPPTCSDLNGPHLRLEEGCGELGWHFRTIVRTPTRAATPGASGYLGSATSQAAKMSGDRTFRSTRFRAGAQFMSAAARSA